jgi:hypothetical protein
VAARYYHYTSRYFAQNIYCMGVLNSPHGINYLTPDLYNSGGEAAQALAISGKPVEVGCIIPHDAVSAALGSIPPIEPIGGLTHPETGEWFRRGGGNEMVVPAPIRLNPSDWIVLDSP